MGGVATATATGSSAGQVVSSATATGGAGGGGGEPGTSGAGADASSSATSSGGAPVSATSTATGGNGGATDLGPGPNGQANADSKSQNSGGTVLASAHSPGGGPASAMSVAAIGQSAPPPIAISPGQSTSIAILTSSGGVGEMSVGYGGEGETLVYETTAEFDFTTTQPDPLYLTLVNFDATGDGFDSLELIVSDNVDTNAPPLDVTFTSLRSAEKFFPRQQDRSWRWRRGPADRGHLAPAHREPPRGRLRLQLYRDRPRSPDLGDDAGRLRGAWTSRPSFGAGVLDWSKPGPRKPASVEGREIARLNPARYFAAHKRDLVSGGSAVSSMAQNGTDQTKSAGKPNCARSLLLTTVGNEGEESRGRVRAGIDRSNRSIPAPGQRADRGWIKARKGRRMSVGVKACAAVARHARGLGDESLLGHRIAEPDRLAGRIGEVRLRVFEAVV